MPTGPVVHVMCGLVGVGKTTVAKQLAEELPAVRLTRDEWMLRLVGGRFDHDDYVAALGTCTEMLWEIANGVISAETDVVLDWNHWSVQLRRDVSTKARELGADVVVHFVDVPVDIAIARAIARADSNSHELTADDVTHMATLLEPPDTREGLTIVRH